MSADALTAPGEPSRPPGEAEHFETRHVARDGRILQMEVWTRIMAVGRQSAELVFALDVTERRAFGQALIDAVAGARSRNCPFSNLSSQLRWYCARASA